MSGQIRMTPEQLQAKAKRYGNSSDQIEQILRDLSNLQVELRSEWEKLGERSAEVKKWNHCIGLIAK